MCHNPLDRVKCRVIHNNEIAPNIYDMSIDVGNMVDGVLPGQFVNLYVKGGVHLLPRPISICSINEGEKTMRVIYAVVGDGTRILRARHKRDSVEILGPLGRGFTTDPSALPGQGAKNILIVGGGVGTPPLLQLAKKLKETDENIHLTIVLGFRNHDYLVDEFKNYGDVHVATDSGKTGFKGNVIELMESELDLTPGFDYMYACGPTPMLRGLQQFNFKYNIAGEFSLEERMGCGFGACVGCVTPIRKELDEASLRLSKETMEDSDYDYKKVCKDGPVFDMAEVIF